MSRDTFRSIKDTLSLLDQAAGPIPFEQDTASLDSNGWHHAAGAANVSINVKLPTATVVRQFIERTSISVFQSFKQL